MSQMLRAVVNPDRGDSSWFEAERQFVVRIGEHNFYT